MGSTHTEQKLDIYSDNKKTMEKKNCHYSKTLAF